jgi:hypothetical protein
MIGLQRTDVLVDMLGFEEIVQAFDPVKPAEAALAIAACFNFGEQLVVRIDPDRAGTDFLCDAWQPYTADR